MKLLSQVKIEGFGEISAPPGVPVGGLGSAQQIGQAAATIFVIVAVTLTLFVIIVSGIQWIMSEGNKTKIQAARNRLIFGIVGLLVVLLSYFIVRIVGGLFGVALL